MAFLHKTLIFKLQYCNTELMLEYFISSYDQIETRKITDFMGQILNDVKSEINKRWVNNVLMFNTKMHCHRIWYQLLINFSHFIGKEKTIASN